MADKEDYLQSPIDDLESFYNVFLWAVLHNKDSQEALSASARETWCRDKLSGSVDARGYAQRALQREVPTAPIVKQLHGIIRAWGMTQVGLQEKYDVIKSKYGEVAANKSFGQDGTTEQVYWKWAWNLIAYEGVQRIVEIIYSYRDELTTYPSFNEA